MATQTVDDMLVQLMSMGFELPDCQEAVQYGKVTVEEAVEWLLAGKPGLVKTEGTPTLKLSKEQGADLGATSNPFVNPVAVSQTTTSIAASQLSPEPSCEESDETVISRMHLNREQRKVRDKFEEHVRDEAQKKAKEEKIKAKQERARILQQIAEDRDKVKMMRVVGPKAESSSVSSTPSCDESSAPTEFKHADKCTLQIRLPDGRSLRQSFQSDDTLNVVWDFVYSRNRNIANMAFIQPFPRREFSKDEQGRTLNDLGLTPSGSLVLQNRSKPEVQPPEQMETDPPACDVSNSAEDGTDHRRVEEEDNDGDDHHHDDDDGDEIGSFGSHRWGRGHRLDNDAEVVPVDADDIEVDEANDEDDVINNIFGNRLANLPGLPGMPGFGGHPQQQVFEGFGRMLVPAGVPGDDRGHHRLPAAQLAAEAARHRYVQPGQEHAEHEEQTPTLSVQAPALLHLCILKIVKRLCDPRNPLLSLGRIAQELAQKVLAQLMKEGKLKPKTLQVFVSCYLRRLILDCYPYTTNELLQAARYHVNLSHVSLNSCTLFTDQGLKPLTGLKKLKVLNLGSCRQLSNKCLSVVAELPCLQTLNLENTVISNSGFLEYVSQCTHQLLHLNLNRTAVTHTIIPHLKIFQKLKSLYLEQTKVSSLSGVQDLQQLEVLDVAHTDIVTDSLLCLASHPALTCLSITNTENVIGDLALQYLSGLKLQTLYLPSRHTTTSSGLAHLVVLPLTSLDLTNYINVGDEGMIHVGKMTTLKKLLLGNTKITDQGMIYLQGLVNLETLYLDRTFVSDVGAACIQAFTKLEELSLSSTSITSQFLCAGTLNACHMLSKVNLSRTSVSDKGIQNLRLQSLTLLNLDMTHIHQRVIPSLYENCPKLQRVTLANLNPIEEEDEMEV